MSKTQPFDLAMIDPTAIWSAIESEAKEASESDSFFASALAGAVLKFSTVSDVIVNLIAERFQSSMVSARHLRQILTEQKELIPNLDKLVTSDILAFRDRDPACQRFIEPLLYYKGFLALQAHRFAHSFLQDKRFDLAFYLQSRSSSVLQTDIHPAAKIGHSIFIDHATGLVVGETAVIENEVSLLHGVTLGGTGKQTGDRHPKVRRGVLIGAGAKILGNIEIGECAKVASGSVVLKPIPAYATAAGVPAKIYGERQNGQPAKLMDQTFAMADGI